MMSAIEQAVMEFERCCALTEAPSAYEALDAAESILRYTPNFSTNCGGMKPSMTTQRALRLVRAALAKLDEARRQEVGARIMQAEE
jgi:hypothetical protein